MNKCTKCSAGWLYVQTNQCNLLSRSTHERLTVVTDLKAKADQLDIGSGTLAIW